MILTSVADILRAGRAAGARPHRDVLRRRGERRRRGLAPRRPAAARVVRRRDRGDQRGRRVLDLGRRPPGVPAAGGREGPDLDPARRARPRRRTAAGVHRDNADHAPRGGRRGARPHRVAGAPDRHHRGTPRAASATSAASAPDDPDALAATTGAASGFLRSTLRTTTNPTGLTAGYKHNVIPDRPRRSSTCARCPAPRMRPSPTSGASSATTSRSRSSHQRHRARGAVRGRPRRRDGRRARPARPGRPRHPVPDGRRHRQQGARAPSASPATASRRCGFPPTSTSPACSTAWTSASRSTRSCSDSAC